MAAEDWLPEGIDSDHWYVKRKHSVTCNRCGKGGLQWEEDNDGWVLVTAKGEIHQCELRKAAADDFEALA